MENEKKLNQECIDQDSNKVECVGRIISPEVVRNWTANYRKNNVRTTTSHLFGIATIKKILAQKGCAGIRIHYAIDDHGQKQLILSGVDSNGRDQTPQKMPNITNSKLTMEAEPIGEESSQNGFNYYDQSWPCPGTQGCPAN